MLSNPLGLAARQAALKGTCPVWELDDFYTDHWDFPTLCSSFGCTTCVATPEDMGPGDWEPIPVVSGDDEIPF